MSELLPCPFCGGRPSVVSQNGMFWIDCEGDECGNHDTREAAIAAWNRRTNESPLRNVATELLRLYDWRFELAKEESAARFLAQNAGPGDSMAAYVVAKERVSRNLRQYGDQKKAAWDALRELLAKPTIGKRLTEGRY